MSPVLSTRQSPGLLSTPMLPVPNSAPSRTRNTVQNAWVALVTRLILHCQPVKPQAEKEGQVQVQVPGSTVSVKLPLKLVQDEHEPLAAPLIVSVYVGQAPPVQSEQPVYGEADELLLDDEEEELLLGQGLAEGDVSTTMVPARQPAM
jgi:hypothetical protein